MRQIFVDSRDRKSGSSTDFAIQLPETMTIGSGHRARCDNLRVPLVIPTIRSGVNDTLIVQLGAQQYTITIPQAQYDGPGLAAAIQGRLQASPPGAWTVAYDISNVSMSISCSSNFTIVGGTYGAQLMTRSYTQTANQYKFAYVDVLGGRYSLSLLSEFRHIGYNRSHRQPRHLDGRNCHATLRKCDER
jgi:hypothetical protein